MAYDFDFVEMGSITLVVTLNPDAEQHLADNVGEEAQWVGGGLAVEGRYGPELAASLCRAGYTVCLPDGRVVSEEDLAET